MRTRLRVVRRMQLERPAVRNYRVCGLSPRYTVMIRHANGSISDSGERPSEWGTWGLSRHEAAIIRSGMTRGGRDRSPR